jgi:hypothetical protein
LIFGLRGVPEQAKVVKEAVAGRDALKISLSVQFYTDSVVNERTLLAIESLSQGDRAFNSTYPPEPIRVSVALAPRRAKGNAMQLPAISEGPSMAL